MECKEFPDCFTRGQGKVFTGSKAVGKKFLKESEE